MPVIMAMLVLGVVSVACSTSSTGTPCQPNDEAGCGEGYQCVTFCSGELVNDQLPPPQSICAPEIGTPSRGTYDHDAVITSRAAYSEVINVTHITRSLRVSGLDVLGAAFPLLEVVDGDVVVEANNTLQCFSAPKLKSIGGVLTIDSNVDLSVLELPSLISMGGLKVADNGALKELSLQTVETLGTATGVQMHVVEDNSQLAELDLEKLVTISSVLVVHGSDGATPITSLDSLTEGCIDITAFDAQVPTCPTTSNCRDASGTADGFPCCTCMGWQDLEMCSAGHCSSYPQMDVR